MEVMRDSNDNVVIICAIENIDAMGAHTGDSITVAPAQTLTDREYQNLRNASLAIMREIGVECGEVLVEHVEGAERSGVDQDARGIDRRIAEIGDRDAGAWLDVDADDPACADVVLNRHFTHSPAARAVVAWSIGVRAEVHRGA